MAHALYAHVAASEKVAFSAYATEIGFAASEVGRFLVLRELRVGRLGSLKELFGKPVIDACSTKNKKNRIDSNKITAHLPSRVILSYFQEHAQHYEVSASEALAILVRTELEERRLEIALNA